MPLTTLFISLCLPTGLDCADIPVSYGSMEPSIEAKALMYSTGRYEIIVSKTQALLPEYVLKESLVHEIAHIEAFESSRSKGRKINNGHGTSWLKACRSLSKQNGINTLHCGRI